MQNHEGKNMVWANARLLKLHLTQQAMMNNANPEHILKNGTHITLPKSE